MCEKREIKIEYTVYKNLGNLNEIDQKLIEAALGSTKNSYAPYSRLYVGAALLLENNDIITGSNQENASFPLSACAENVALNNYGNLNSEVKIKSIAIAAINNKEIRKTVFPCGGCRNVILEYEIRQNQDIVLYIISQNREIIKINSVKELLPFSFDGSVIEF